MMSHRCHIQSLKTTQLDSFGLILITTMTSQLLGSGGTEWHTASISSMAINIWSHCITASKNKAATTVWPNTAKPVHDNPRKVLTRGSMCRSGTSPIQKNWEELRRSMKILHPNASKYRGFRLFRQKTNSKCISGDQAHHAEWYSWAGHHRSPVHTRSLQCGDRQILTSLTTSQWLWKPITVLVQFLLLFNLSSNCQS